MGDIHKEKRRRKLKNDVLFHQDNAPCHKYCIVMTAIHQVGFELVGHPPYSPDLTPSDYRHFSKLKENLRAKIFSSNENRKYKASPILL